MQRKYAQGFSLLEVLITVVLVSIGLLGAIGLQIRSQQFSQNAYFHTQAAVTAHDMLERMRSNSKGLEAQEYNLPDAIKHDSCYTLTGCSTAEMAENDMYEWAGRQTLNAASSFVHNTVSKRLPGGNAVVCIDSTPNDGSSTDNQCDGSGDIYAIKVWWLDLNATEQLVATTVAFK